MAKKIIWLSDIHLNFLQPSAARRFMESIAAHSPDALVITGDIADGRTLESSLNAFAQAVPCPLYFVLGNHDYYHSSLAEIRTRLIDRLAGSNLFYLPRQGPVQLCDGVSLVGHDGWADGRNGDWQGTAVELNDFYLIQELRNLSRGQRFEIIAKLADEAAAYLAAVLPEAAAENRRVVLATHVPPFEAAAFHEGGLCSPDYQPFFSSRTLGETILEVMSRYPACQLNVLCGHTHSAGTYQPAPNVEVRSSAAEYGRPGIAGIFALGEPE